jgi:hypothetical protein
MDLITIAYRASAKDVATNTIVKAMARMTTVH